MRAWILERFDGVGGMRLAEAGDPKLAGGEVLLRMKCASLNPADRYLAQKEYPANPPLPHILGRDGCGEIVAVGSGVVGHSVEQKRAILRGPLGISRWGTFAEFVAAPIDSLIEVPPGWTDEQAGSAPLVYCTAFQALTQWNDLPSRDAVVLVSGASGGVGAATIQLGVAMGHTVIALSRDVTKRAKLQSMGAAIALDPANPHWRRLLTEALSGRKVDLVVDTIGGMLFPQLLATLGERGRVSVVGRLAGDVPQFNTATLLFRRLQIAGVEVGAYTNSQSRDAWKRVLTLLQTSRLQPLIDHVFPFDELPAAFSRLGDGPMGKVLIRCGVGYTKRV